MGEHETGQWAERRLAIIHTTPVTVDPLKTLALELMPGIDVFNIVDDSILPQLAANGGRVDDIRPRWREYAGIAESLGAACILNACSSIGELCAQVQPEIGVPIVRIDQAAAEYAVRSASRIGVAATLATTLEPTQRQLLAKAELAGRQLKLTPVVASTAYRRLLAGDKEGHDEELAAVLRRLAEDHELVVLAQASMARVTEKFPEDERKRFLTSPRLGMERVKQVLQTV
ncbi:aspartate/glutamate racemase family protein [Paenibacillus humicola]|uniref:aspartate/glutamate racemase family protein n=1 Tax=Paenibacillus humicola TaxID=3110540 RepID=UPI00237B8E54|nr:aspartate/glutamate racemase family protein [Paenibacillus humicola]